ncbi:MULTISPECIES: photosystem II reaction center protein Psb28 [unclassified Roseofilum]|uniref:photosystem II reaction center protein Psb28 n=1 Tax=unclassified Roseofilum TaxID=2620099 RepID=UPI000E82055A|nr:MULTISPECIES: photosystem II reaction center protein Psb28 [unclassified Roseofilum]MBP0009452.1 photosystem II reaction center protein Psb28 [Roseofilum sp. Belize Diploria]MBP0033919.1 photosystem II reaction center protein Psb28 [Roseofilum sp. Belize BBD 4]HBQ97127.1 photosystem II reaction center protein Psb28 [Cyanobacteria bacterium UBA11691]
MAEIQLTRGITEKDVPEVRLTRAKNKSSGTATFIFSDPTVFKEGNTDEVTGLHLIDEEGEIVSREVKAKFIDGKPTTVEALYVMEGEAKWDRFMRFMERYAKDHGLGFQKA